MKKMVFIGIIAGLIISVTKSSRTNQPVPADFRYRIIRADADTIVLAGGDAFRKETK